MDINLEDSWKRYLSAEFDKEYFANLTELVRQEYQNHLCFPPGQQVFNAFNLCPFDDVKVVIIGQDPYYKPGQAMGLSFSVPVGTTMPRSLINIFKEIQQDLGNPIPQDGDLTRWSKQGVLLLNATLTVRAHDANSHKKLGWNQFTDAAIKALSDHRQGLVYMLWGSDAQKKRYLINQQENLILESVHPSLRYVKRERWFGQHQFSRCNAYLESKGIAPIHW